ncbi:MAG: septum formation protein Maf [Chloroflexi bacterium]|nr:septum formation protein Maf [Chloroflexota bacterium]
MRLASGSPRRARILREAGFVFEVEQSRIDERPPPSRADPDEEATLLAATKAADVAKRHPGELVLGADTLVVLNDRVLGKPGGASDAIAVLRRLRGRTHRVVTGVALDGALGRAAGTRTTSVTFRRYTDDEIRQYVDSGAPLDKAGSYGIQDDPFRPADSILGCYLNVVGLPLCLTAELMEHIGAFKPGSSRPVCPHDRGTGR